MSEQTRWRRNLGEATMIVASILLAFWIDAWWDGLGEAQDERESLELVSRDLNATIAQLTVFTEYAEKMGTDGLKAMEALSAKELDAPLELSRLIQRASNRKTIAFPTAAYTDMVSTGTLRLIKNRELRDAIVRFYELAELAQRVLEKNSSLAIDKHLYGFYQEGLLLWRTDIPWGFSETQEIATKKAAAVLSDDFEYGPDYYWSLSSDSVEWHRLRSSLSLASHTLFMGREYALKLMDDARTLDDKIRRELDTR